MIDQSQMCKKRLKYRIKQQQYFDTIALRLTKTICIPLAAKLFGVNFVVKIVNVMLGCQTIQCICKKTKGAELKSLENGIQC